MSIKLRPSPNIHFGIVTVECVALPRHAPAVAAPYLAPYLWLEEIEGACGVA
jgi:hypothetical protein